MKDPELLMMALKVMGWLMGMLIVACGTVIWWGFQGIVKSQREVSSRLSHIDLCLERLNGQLAMVEQWQEEHEQKDDERTEFVTKRLEAVERQLRDLLTKGG